MINVQKSIVNLLKLLAITMNNQSYTEIREKYTIVQWGYMQQTRNKNFCFET